MRTGAPGSAKRMVPKETTLAPAATTSRASSPELTPPIPTIGTSTARAQAAMQARATGLRAGPGVPPGPATELRAQGGGVERQAANRVDQREAVRPRGHDCLGRLADVRRRRRELRVQRFRGAGAAAVDDLGRRLGRFLDVRTREVELDHLHVLATVEALANPGVVGNGEAANRDPDPQPDLRQRGERLVDEAVDPGALKTDRVQHARGRLGDAHGSVALAGQRRDRLRHEAVERERNVGCSESVETAARVEDRDGHAARRTGPAIQSRCRRPSTSTTQP